MVLQGYLEVVTYEQHRSGQAEFNSTSLICIPLTLFKVIRHGENIYDHVTGHQPQYRHRSSGY
jgi:hypothetical protein